MYTHDDFRTKKALKDAIEHGQVVTVYQPGLGDPPPHNGSVTLEGPHYPRPHKWYATAVLKDGRVVSVK